jgi:hypothetical protein
LARRGRGGREIREAEIIGVIERRYFFLPAAGFFVGLDGFLQARLGGFVFFFGSGQFGGGFE